MILRGSSTRTRSDGRTACEELVKRKGTPMQKELVILDEDKTWARARIAELDAEIQALAIGNQCSMPSANNFVLCK